MSMSKKIRTILLERNMNIKDLSIKMDCKPKHLYNKLGSDKFTEQELIEIANALDCDYDGIFTLRDTGKKI